MFQVLTGPRDAAAPNEKQNNSLFVGLPERNESIMPSKTPRFEASALARSEEALIPLMGASLLSSVGSLPLHLAPLIVATLISDSRVSLVGAGWLPTVLLLGQLSTSLILPTFGIHNIRRGAAIVTATVFLTGLAISSFDGFEIILLGWFLVGQSCGVLMYLGTIAASQFPRKTFAFSLRLAVVLVLAGTLTCLLQVANSFASYRALLTTLTPIVGLILACGVLLHRPAAKVGQVTVAKDSEQWSTRQLSGLVTIYFFFVSLTGFLAYVVQQALTRGISLPGSVWSMAGMKLIAGLWLLCVALLEVQEERKERFMFLAALLTAGLLAVYFSRSVTTFFLGLVLFEITFNTLSARLQGAVVTERPQFAGPWLTGAILLGAATGPPLHGLAINSGLGDIFVLMTVLAAHAPLIWRRSTGLESRPN